jgi:hypothetical protein
MRLSSSSHPGPSTLRLGLLTLALALGQVPSADAQWLWEDGFDGPALDPAWQLSTWNTASWSGGFEAGAWHLQAIQAQQNNTWCEVILGRDLPCRDGWLITAELGWAGSTIQVMQQALLRLRDDGGEVLARGGFYDAWVGARGSFYACVGSNCQQQPLNQQPYVGQLTLQASLDQGQLSLVLDGTPYASGPLDSPIAHLELVFAHYEYPTSTLGGVSVTNLRLESPLAAPALSIQADSSLVLQWPVQHCSAVRIYQAPSPDSPWPGGYSLLGEAPAGTAGWPLPAPAADSRAVYRVTRVED